MRCLLDLFRDPTQMIVSIPASLRHIFGALALTMVNVTAEPDTPASLVVRSVVAAFDLTRTAQ